MGQSSPGAHCLFFLQTEAAGDEIDFRKRLRSNRRF